MSVTILGIESSCDDTSAAIIQDGYVLSNVIAGQEVHKLYGGVVPELASRAHQQNIVPVIDTAIKKAGLNKKDINAIAFTKGPGLLGSLLVGTSFAKGLSLSLNIPLIDVNHLLGHVHALFLKEKGLENNLPPFPFLCLLVSGGHSQLIVVKDHFSMEVIGNTIDDAAGEAFDKCAKIMDLPYPGGPVIDEYSKKGNANAFQFSKPKIKGNNYSFSGLKTSFLYTLRDELKTDPDFITKNLHDLCASIQKTIIEVLLDKLLLAAKQTKIKHIAVVGGVSANSHLRAELNALSTKHKWELYVPHLSYTTDNAAMIGIAGYYKYLNNDFCGLDVSPKARLKIV